jgi:uncharacterized protein YlxW (UPF0749 family)
MSSDADPTPPRGSVWTVGVGLVSLLAGLLLVAGATAADGSDLRSERRSDLTDLIRAREAEVAARSDRLRSLDEEVQRLVAEGADAPTDAARGEESLEQAAGLAPLAGPALTVELDDAPRQPGAPLPNGVRPDDLVVHQQDIQAVVNALWAGGAEGMRIMDQRVVATSAVRCVGNTLILQGRVYSPPFRITAVGDPDRLARALDDEPGVNAYREWSKAVGLGYQVDREEAVVLDPYDGPLDLTYAEGAR